MINTGRDNGIMGGGTFVSEGLRGRQAETRGGDMHIGAISIFTLIIVLCMAVLAVLTISSSHSSLVMAQRQADTTTGFYANEAAAQTFVAELDKQMGDSGLSSVEGNLDRMCDNAANATNVEVEATATMDGNTVEAQFTGESGRILTIQVTLNQDGTYDIESWRMSGIEPDEEPLGNLYISD